MHCSDIGKGQNEIVKSSSGRQPSRLEGEPRDVVYHDDSCLSPAAEALSITEEDEEGLSRRASCFEIALADILHIIQRKWTDGCHCSWSIC